MRETYLPRLALALADRRVSTIIMPKPLATGTERSLRLVSVVVSSAWIVTVLSSGFNHYIFISIAFGLLVAGAYSYSVARRRGWRTVKAAGFLICPHCRYDLRSLDAAIRCPECGRSYTAASLEDTWSRSYRAESVRE
jgi:hypothetical protein